ncbi:TrmH family RNA methyltransferase [Xylanibacter muris]|uniref:RNA methyltransferase n=1 Tax=Xylanibacter muris TaxID=2736290 RepID=A0ABX2AL43_9BACT|nr:RNA methyltransferase [Xylanibacter muris]NPD91500.1 RNA methyltransferase [Xylanibacter muris]
MLSKNLIKTVKSLEHKKGRKKNRLFVAEGPKIISEMFKKYAPQTIIATKEWLENNDNSHSTESDIIEVTDEELRKISFLQHPQQVLATFRIPKENLYESNNIIPPCNMSENLVLVLDGVQDPGNLGTIIRIADWFGIDNIICSNDTADAYNPKVVQATMGSLAHVCIQYTDLVSFLCSLSPSIPIYGTLLDGSDIYRQELTGNGIIIMGNEGNGISYNVRRFVNRHLLIPHFNSGDTAESLNVAIATAITCSEFRRR